MPPGEGTRGAACAQHTSGAAQVLDIAQLACHLGPCTQAQLSPKLCLGLASPLLGNRRRLPLLRCGAACCGVAC